MLEIKRLYEKEILEKAEDFLEERFKARIMICHEDDKDRYNPELRATLSMPCRPAIYVE